MAEARQIVSLLTSDGELKVSLRDIDRPEPGPDDVIVEVEATPVNPSDLGGLIGPADLAKAHNAADGSLVAPVDKALLARFKPRLDVPLPIGNEGAGKVVAAGSSPAAQALMGKRVACFGGGMYTTHRKIAAAMCMPLPDNASARDGASCFVNPLTALSMVDTMRLDGHTAIIHTAAASNLGQMLNRICQSDGVPLVNIVRRADQADLLLSAGAKHVCNSSDTDFRDRLVDAIVETGASIAFDAIGGGKLGDQILTCMEQAFSRNAETWSPYGSTVFKQLYIYGGLDLSPTTLNRGYGMAWGVGGYLLPHFMERVGPERVSELQARVGAELKTTFATHYTAEISLSGMLDVETARAYQAKATGEKFLVTPQAD